MRCWDAKLHFSSKTFVGEMVCVYIKALRETGDCVDAIIRKPFKLEKIEKTVPRRLNIGT
jgi:hypothetical protein